MIATRLTLSSERSCSLLDFMEAARAKLSRPARGDIMLELTGFFDAVGRDPVPSYGEILTRMSIGLGYHAPATARSQSTARRRAVRADQAEAASALP